MRYPALLTLLSIALGATLVTSQQDGLKQTEKLGSPDVLCILSAVNEAMGCFENGVNPPAIWCLVKAIVKIGCCFFKSSALMPALENILVPNLERWMSPRIQ